MGTKKRNSSIELLKLISIILIVLSHAAASAPIATKNGGGGLVLFNSLKKPTDEAIALNKAYLCF